jgi:hypothetical protein
MTDDPGMKDFLNFIARDVMHQQQWLAVLEDLGGLQAQLPIPNSFDHAKERTEFSHTFFSTVVGDDAEPPRGRSNQGPSLDGKAEFDVKRLRPMGEEPQLAPPIPEAFAQLEEMRAGKARIARHGTSSTGIAAGGAGGSLDSEGIVTRIMDSVTQLADEVTGRGTETGSAQKDRGTRQPARVREVAVHPRTKPILVLTVGVECRTSGRGPIRPCRPVVLSPPWRPTAPHLARRVPFATTRAPSW